MAAVGFAYGVWTVIGSGSRSGCEEAGRDALPQMGPCRPKDTRKMGPSALTTPLRVREAPNMGGNRRCAIQAGYWW